MQFTEQEQQAINRGEEVPLTVDQIECVVIRRDVWEKIKTLYDDSEWTEEEMRAAFLQTADDLDNAGPIE